MKLLAALAATLALSLTASAPALTAAAARPAPAPELPAADAGTFVVLDRQQAPTELYYRLSQSSGQWLMEGKQADATWTNISCEAACQYRPSTAADIEALFPPTWRERADLACIQNHAQAFCRYSPKGNAAAANYVVVALVTGKPIPIFV